MIADLKNRPLTWYFENIWLPEHRGNMHGSLVSVVRETVESFVIFAAVDPPLSEITAAALREFEQFCRSRGLSAAAAIRRRQRVEAVVRHALPIKAQTPQREATLPPAADGTLRQYVRDELPTLKPDLRPRSIGDYARVVNRFVEWLGDDVAIADVTPEMVDAFEEGNGQSANTNLQLAWRLRSLMRTFDPVRFRSRRPSLAETMRKPLNTGNGSQFLLSNLYEQRYEPSALLTRRPNTKRLYRTTLLMFDRFLGRPATLDDLNDDTVSRYAAWRLHRVCRHSLNKDLFNLLAIWRWANRKGLVEAWPDIRMEKPPKRVPMAWTEKELRKIYKTIRQLKGKVGRFPACDWWAALLLVAWDSCERINAVFELDWSNVDLRRGWVRFTAESRKGGREDSAVELSKEAIEALRRIRAKGGPVFPWPNCYTYLWKRYAKILQLAGLPHDSKCKFHRIRRTGASFIEAAGGNATAMLRHSKREITEAYLDPRITKPQQPADLLFRLTEA